MTMTWFEPPSASGRLTDLCTGYRSGAVAASAARSANDSGGAK
jgi:hypothetical protein